MPTPILRHTVEGNAVEQPVLAADIAAGLEAQINLNRLSARGAATEGAVDPLGEVRARAWVNPHLPIGWPEMPRGARAKLRAILQKVARRLLRWYVQPLVAQQNEFNEAVVSALHVLHTTVRRETALGAAERESLRMALARQEGSRLESATSKDAPADGSAPAEHRPLHLPWCAPQPALDPDALEPVIERMRFAQQIGAMSVLPVLLLADEPDELIGRIAASDLPSLVCQADGSAASPRCSGEPVLLASASLSGVIWAAGVWRYDAPGCLRLLDRLAEALAPGAPLVLITISPDDGEALTRHVWADPATVRPYAPALLIQFLRYVGLESAAELPQSQFHAAMRAVCAYRAQH